MFQKDGGLVDAATANSVHIQLARGNGATIIDNCPVTRLTKDNQGIITVSISLVMHYFRRKIKFLCTYNPFYTHTRHSDEIRYNDNLNVTKTSLKKSQSVTKYARIFI